jgi:hypothetical protein
MLHTHHFGHRWYAICAGIIEQAIERGEGKEFIESADFRILSYMWFSANAWTIHVLYLHLSTKLRHVMSDLHRPGQCL